MEFSHFSLSGPGGATWRGGLLFKGHFSMSNHEHVSFIPESMCTTLSWFQGVEGFKFIINANTMPVSGQCTDQMQHP